MKNFATKLVLAGTAIYLSIGTASAEFCGAEGLPACKVPEPDTGFLLLAAIGAAAAIAKFRKK
jgi:hypothetical protein